MNQPEYRHEYKHSVSLSDYFTIRRRIGAVAAPDPNAGPDGRYHIRSLYFDNDDDKALREKLYGLPNREKFRIRLYKDDFIRLEKKSKARGFCSKQTATLSRSQAESILSGDTGWMLESEQALFAELYGKMLCQGIKPRTIVDYWREAYVFPYGNVRVTFDTDIRTGLYSTGLFDPDIPTIKAVAEDTPLLEIKYGKFLPDLIRDLIQTNTRRSEAFSKYAVCRIYG